VPDTKISALTALTGLAKSDLFVVVDVSDTTMAASGTTKYITAANVGVGLVSTASIPFTDGDTYRRVTVTDANVLSTSNIVCSIRRPNTTDDSADLGLLYLCTVLSVSNGSFDVGVACLDWGFDDPTPSAVSETVTLCYTIG
jgi:hypothetical protein